MKFIIVIYITVAVKLSSLTAYSSTKDWKCEANKTPLCQGLYNQTRFPNYFAQRSQEDGAMELNGYKDLISTHCAEHLRLFLCSLFVPMCTMLDKPLKPCRSLCMEVKQGCEKVLQHYVNLSWPERLRCDQFPVGSETGEVCIEDKRKKSTEVKEPKKVWVREKEKTKIQDGEVAVLACDGKKKINFRKINHPSNKCSRSVSLNSIRKRCNGERLCHIKLKDLAKLDGQPKTCIEGQVGSSYLKFHCADRKPSKRITLKHGEDKNIYCKSSSRHIKIVNAQFRDFQENSNCITPNAFCRVSQSCTGKQSCGMWADRQYIPSLCKGQKPTLIVDYECEKNSAEEKVLTDYWENLTLECHAGSVLKIIRAEYVSRSCMNNNVYCAVDYMCNNKPKCIFKLSDDTAVKCKKERSKILVRYTCI